MFGARTRGERALVRTISATGQEPWSLGAGDAHPSSPPTGPVTPLLRPSLLYYASMTKKFVVHRSQRCSNGRHITP